MMRTNATMMNATLAVALAVGITACRFNSKYCEGNPGNNCDLSWDASHPPDGSATPGCTTNAECSAPKAVCDLDATKTCVQCTAASASACTAMTPVCGGDDACRACKAHGECPSNACLPDGSCGTDANVAYVDPAGSDNPSCTQAMPCTKVTKALATTRPFLKFHGTTDEAVSINQNVTLLADAGAKLTESVVGIVLEVRGSSQVTVEDLTISDGLGSTGYGFSMPAGNTANVTLRRVKLLNNAGGGVTVSGGTLTMTQSTVSGNAGGGISISGAQFSLVNNFITQNGSVTSPVGGVQLSNITAGSTHQIDFNTITANGGAATVVTGVSCGTITVPLTFSNNIVYGNVVTGGGTQVGGSANCRHAYSDVGPDAVTGTGNLSVDPLFISTTQPNFHLTATSTCKDAADPAATLAVDFDGDARPQGVARDIGADEVKP